MTKDEAVKISEEYDELVGRAIFIASQAPFYASVDYEDGAKISFDGSDVVISWKTFQEDYGYNSGGNIANASAKIPISLFMASNEEIMAHIKNAEEEEKIAEKQAMARKSTDHAAYIEFRDRAEWERLKAKFGESK